MKLQFISFILHLTCVCSIFSFEAAVDNSFIGCHYVDVCNTGERCVDDKLFGICKSDDSLYVYEYDIDRDLVAALDRQIKKLIEEHYGWLDLYTQCSLKTLLLQYREHLEYDTSICQPTDYANRETEQRLKREDLIHLHKYFDAERFVSRDPTPDIEKFSIPSEEANYEYESGEPTLDELPRDESNGEVGETPNYYNEEKESDNEYEAEPGSESDIALVEFLQQEAEGREKEKEAEMLHDFEAKVERAELKYVKDLLLGQNNGGEYVSDNDNDVTSLNDLKKRANMAVEQRTAKKADQYHHLISRKNSKETANPNQLVARSGHAKAKTRVTSEDPKKALAQLELTKRLLGKRGDVAVIEKNWIWIKFTSLELNETTREGFLKFLGKRVDPNLRNAISEINGKEIDIKVPDPRGYSSLSAEAILKKLKNVTTNIPQYKIEDCGLGRKNHLAMKEVEDPIVARNFVLTVVICGSVLATVVIMVVLFSLQKHKASVDKLKEVTKTNPFADGSTDSYKELCRQRMDTKNTDKTSPVIAGQQPGASIKTASSAWSEEPVQTNMDISTGHMILSYMEEHLKNKDKLEAEWQVLKAYETEHVSTEHANKGFNLDKNRFQDAVPFDHNRVVLKKSTSSGSDFINASYVVDHDPKKPSYILTQGPLVNTVSDFWQMVWEQGSLVIVSLTRLSENGMSLCFKYWPEEGSSLFNKYEVHLVSEHVWCEDYLVRSFYLKNIDSGETRTVTQFHFLNWTELSVPANPKSILDFRRKVNKSFRGKQSPVIVHCSDGCGRSGTFTLLDMILNRTNKGVKEIDIAATLEHLRDQRCDVVKSKEQFEFVLTAIAEEVNAVLKALPH